MASLNDIVNGLAATIEGNIPGLTAYSYMLPGGFSLPCVMLEPIPGDYTQAFAAGDDKWTILVYALVSAGGDQSAAQSELNTLITGWGPSSIRQVIYDNKNLGLADGTVAMATGAHSFTGKIEIGTVETVCAVVNVLVHTDPKQYVTE